MLFDTSAWIEVFLGTEQGKTAVEVIKSGKNFTSIATFAEIANWCLKNNSGDKIGFCIDTVKKGSQVLGLNEEISTIAGRLNYERKKAGKKWGMIDSMIVTTAQAYGLKILTKDAAFKDLPDVEILS
ncbi:MAG: PIN domain-containing protein [Candidatus Woesearchaeota archaeon]